MLPGAQKKWEKNSCSRFPSVFLILVFFFISYFFVFVYSLVAPSEKEKIESAPAERSSDRQKEPLRNTNSGTGHLFLAHALRSVCYFSFFFFHSSFTFVRDALWFILPTGSRKCRAVGPRHADEQLSASVDHARCDFSLLAAIQIFSKRRAHTPGKKLCFIPSIKQRYTTADNRSDAAFSPAVVSFVFRCSLR